MYKAIIVEGKDAEAFLQGQLTQDVSLIPEGASLPAAWCNPKGRVFVTMTVCRSPQGFVLVVPASMSERTVQKLTMYRLRAEVDIVPSNDIPDHAVIASDPESLIEAGIAVIDDSNTESFTPHMLNLDKLGAISFQKGCYTGQEVVARTEHLGKSKRRMMRYEADGDGICSGDKLAHGERNIGEVVNVVGRDLLAVAPLDSHRSSLECNGIVVRPAGLPYEI